jgi:hypothetical protein
MNDPNAGIDRPARDDDVLAAFRRRCAIIAAVVDCRIGDVTVYVLSSLPDR